MLNYKLLIIRLLFRQNLELVRQLSDETWNLPVILHRNF